MDESIRTAPPALDLRDHRKPWLSAREWRLHGGLFVLTVLTTTLAGIGLGAPELIIILVIVLLLFGGLIVLSQGSAVAPFIYTLF